MFMILGNMSHQGVSAAGESFGVARVGMQDNSGTARVGMQDSRSSSCSWAVGGCTAAHGLHRMIPFQATERHELKYCFFYSSGGYISLFPALSMPLRTGGLCNS